MGNSFYKYYVEGECERVVVNALKNDLKMIFPGKVEVFNVNQEQFTNLRLRTLKKGSTVILVYDTDVGDEKCLQKNIDFLNSKSNVKNIICIPQVNNLEDELLNSCAIREIKEITKSKSNKNFKSDISNCSNFSSRLLSCGFDFSKFWMRKPNNSFKKHGNNSRKIRIKRR